MDTSKEYINMCKEAKEIQKDLFHNIPIYSFCYLIDAKQIKILGSNFLGRNIKDYMNVIWLPRQDQLQDMLLANNKNKIHLLQSFYMNLMEIKMNEHIETHQLQKWVFDQVDYLNTTIEQLWLIFTMKENYNKIWKDKKWEINTIKGDK